MPTARTRDSSRGIEFDSSFSGFVLKSFRPIVAMVLLGAALAGSSCKRQSAEFQTEKPKPSTEAQPASPEKKDRKTSYSREGYAVWYVVPANSLAKRRAGKGELTAAHTHLPLQTMVRVTHLANGKSVIVRITDRCITKTGASIDLCKEAAEKLGMVSEGMARVRMEELPDDKGTDATPDSKATAAHP
jgi:rare lipoprotein A